jgi:hypothetical protein
VCRCSGVGADRTRDRLWGADERWTRGFSPDPDGRKGEEAVDETVLEKTPTIAEVESLRD